jgi:hypothetical protein
MQLTIVAKVHQRIRGDFDSSNLLLGSPAGVQEPGEVWSNSGEPELLEHERLIELLPALVHLPADHPVHDQPFDRDSLARRRSRPERPSVCAGSSPTECDQITLDQLILHREVEIRKGPQEAPNELFPRADATQWLRNASDMDDAIWHKCSVGG